MIYDGWCPFLHLCLVGTSTSPTAAFRQSLLATFVSDANGSQVENCGQLQAAGKLSKNPFEKAHRPTSLPCPCHDHRLGKGAGCSLEGLARGGPLGGRGPRGERRARTGELGRTRTREVGGRGVVESGRGSGAGQRGRAGRRERRGREPRLEVHGRGAAWLGLGLGLGLLQPSPSPSPQP